jgi:hypothetical protein
MKVKHHCVCESNSEYSSSAVPGVLLSSFIISSVLPLHYTAIFYSYAYQVCTLLHSQPVCGITDNRQTR